jgi:hypothetical protein
MQQFADWIELHFPLVVFPKAGALIGAHCLTCHESEPRKNRVISSCIPSMRHGFGSWCLFVPLARRYCSSTGLENTGQC